MDYLKRIYNGKANLEETYIKVGQKIPNLWIQQQSIRDMITNKVNERWPNLAPDPDSINNNNSEKDSTRDEIRKNCAEAAENRLNYPK